MRAQASLEALLVLAAALAFALAFVQLIGAMNAGLRFKAAELEGQLTEKSACTIGAALQRAQEYALISTAFEISEMKKNDCGLRVPGKGMLEASGRQTERE